MFGVFGRQPPKASTREAALETENSALKAEVAALRRRLGEDEGPGKAATPRTAKPRPETQAATGTKRARDGDGEARPKKNQYERQMEKKLAKMPAWERALHESPPSEEKEKLVLSDGWSDPGGWGPWVYPGWQRDAGCTLPQEQIDREWAYGYGEKKWAEMVAAAGGDEEKAFKTSLDDARRKSKEQFQKRWEETASLRPFRHQDLAADDEATRRDARVWYEGLKVDYLKNECRALGLIVQGNKSELYKRIAGWARYGRKRDWGDGVCEMRTFCRDRAFYCVSTDEYPRVDPAFWAKPQPYGGMLVKWAPWPALSCE